MRSTTDEVPHNYVPGNKQKKEEEEEEENREKRRKKTIDEVPYIDKLTIPLMLLLRLLLLLLLLLLFLSIGGKRSSCFSVI